MVVTESREGLSLSAAAISEFNMFYLSSRNALRQTGPAVRGRTAVGRALLLCFVAAGIGPGVLEAGVIRSGSLTSSAIIGSFSLGVDEGHDPGLENSTGVGYGARSLAECLESLALTGWWGGESPSADVEKEDAPSEARELPQMAGVDSGGTSTSPTDSGPNSGHSSAAIGDGNRGEIQAAGEWISLAEALCNADPSPLGVLDPPKCPGV